MLLGILEGKSRENLKEDVQEYYIVNGGEGYVDTCLKLLHIAKLASGRHFSLQVGGYIQTQDEIFPK